MYGTYAPETTSRALSEPSVFRYVVQEDDSLASIADKLNTTEKRLRELNPLLTTSGSKKRVKLYPGQQLVVEEAKQVSLPPPPECIDNGWGQMHVVRSGETLKSIATQYNTREEYIRQDNRQYFPAGERGILFPGQMLHIRYVNIGQLEPEEEVPANRKDLGVGGSEALTRFSKYKTHTIAKKDTFDSICEAYNITYARLLQINRGRFPVGARAELVVGEQLIVPDHYASQVEERRRNIAEIKLTKQIHIVEADETPQSIAERYRMTYDELRGFNRAYFPKGYRGEIRPGFKLVVKRVFDEDEYQSIDDYQPERA
ncbi:hypothetical protein Poli38472_005105 [Pythium oligandrum]|uniref:LysM domain-containing protein n=1 Tax=Pythium oligandrum TaxID=41045 RepID=A0A8K1CI12_PYTOL|nr:hypothetical protein Poli38472_005105 [Pythium oligandrum]|eukprot:TMW62487.1 hypothetical protein Poli38472_005105 [Pythium oligandrum]